MKLFVTGGAGFIGSNYVHAAVESGNEVTVFDALTYAGNRLSLAAQEDNPNFHFVLGDVTDPDAVAGAIKGHDVVIHFAAETHVDRSIVDPHRFVATNCVGTSVVMRCALDAGIDRVVHVSTDEVYGSIDEGQFDEASLLEPSSPYSASKAGSDLIALSYQVTYGLPVVVTRSSNQFGPYQFPEKLIPLFITNLIEGKPVGLYGDGLNVRDWLYVEDNVSGIDTVMRFGEVGKIYNIDGGNEMTNRDIAFRLVELCDADHSLVRFVEDRLGHDRRYAINGDNVRALGWQPRCTFDDALVATVGWYKTNEDWWRPLKERSNHAGGNPKPGLRS